MPGISHVACALADRYGAIRGRDKEFLEEVLYDANTQNSEWHDVIF